MFLLERIKHFIAYELKEIIQPSTFFCFNFLKALKSIYNQNITSFV
ncbi:Uncharacterised protein [Proteus mirabilis]|nr:Uncharacterised protein [Proteus mirabilis]